MKRVLTVVVAAVSAGLLIADPSVASPAAATSATLVTGRVIGPDGTSLVWRPSPHGAFGQLRVTHLDGTVVPVPDDGCLGCLGQGLFSDSYTIDWLQPGQYFVSFSVLNYGTTWAPSDPARRWARPLTVASGETTHLDVTLPYAPANPAMTSPTNVVASAGSARHADLSWTPTVSAYAHSVEISRNHHRWRATDFGSYMAAPPTASVVVTRHGNYRFRIRAWADGGLSAPSIPSAGIRL